MFKNEVHTGPVRGLDFNPKQQNLLASGAINAEVSLGRWSGSSITRTESLMIMPLVAASSLRSDQP